MIVADNLQKTYSRVTAVKDVSFHVEEGEILGFLGPNGAGKTTTMRILTGYTPPTSGRASVAGFDVTKDSIEARRMIGYLPENTPLYTEMDVRSYLHFVAQVKGIAPGDRNAKVLEAMEETGTVDVAQRTIRKLSKGYKQRVGLAQALIGDPKVLILDEPTVGLDPAQIREIRQLIKNMAGKRTVILSTHILPEVSMICKRVLIINNGTIVASDAVGELSKRMAKSREIRLILRAPAAEIQPFFSKVQGIMKVSSQEIADGDGLSQVSIHTVPDQDLRPELVTQITANRWPLYEIRSMEPTLEDIFVDIIAGEKEIDHV
ncbi:MAG: ATP-binding cassette domain-containing protein [bacterium]|jgi:ABC-2 type transport system ATP-binding protein|nr:ATP-binding cassette domain-containing protein [bacterium]